LLDSNECWIQWERYLQTVIRYYEAMWLEAVRRMALFDIAGKWVPT
jgi:hypothetical protein